MKLLKFKEKSALFPAYRIWESFLNKNAPRQFGGTFKKTLHGIKFLLPL